MSPRPCRCFRYASRGLTGYGKMTIFTNNKQKVSQIMCFFIIGRSSSLSNVGSLTFTCRSQRLWVSVLLLVRLFIALCGSLIEDILLTIAPGFEMKYGPPFKFQTSSRLHSVRQKFPIYCKNKNKMHTLTNVGERCESVSRLE